MPYRKTIFAQDQFYHALNRGVASSPIFSSLKDHSRFIELIDYYRYTNPPISFSHLMKLPTEERKRILNKLRQETNFHINILAFCLMKNHFHILLKQVSENGITIFMKNLQNSYAKYFNIKNDRNGSLFQSMFKAIRIETEEQLLHISRYIHLNPSTGYLVEIKDLLQYPWSSLPTYLKEGNLKLTFIDPEPILSLFKNRIEYERFVFDQAEYQRELERIKHLTFE